MTIERGILARRQRLRCPEGTSDILPDDAARRDEVESIAQRIFTAAGYRRIDTPAFESTELFERGVGLSTDIVRKQMFKFNDDRGRSLTLRPEGTAAICRAYVQHGMQRLQHPLRLWFHGAYYRQDVPQAGRFRQFWQVGVEVLGSDEPAIDAECMLLLTELFQALEVPGVRLRLSSLGTAENRARYREMLITHLRRNERDLSAEVRSRIGINPLRAFDSRHPGTQAVMTNAPRLLDHLDTADREHFSEVTALLDAVGVSYDIDPTLVRGLDYYTRTVFEFSSDRLGAQNAVGGGGRFDDLVGELGGPPTAACGGCAGVERVLLSIGERPVARPRLDLYVAVANVAEQRNALRVSAMARALGLAAQPGSARRSLRSQFRHADGLGARYVAVLGTDRAWLKDMISGKQVQIDAAELVPEVAHRLRNASSLDGGQ